MSEISKEDLLRAERFYRAYISPESGLVIVDSSTGILRLGFTDTEKLHSFSIDSVTIGEVTIRPTKHLITIGETYDDVD